MGNSRIALNSLYYSAASLLPTIVGVVMLPIYSQYIKPEEYGVLTLAQTFAAFLPMFLTLELHTAISRFYFDYSGRNLNVFVSTITVSICIVALIVGVPIFYSLRWIVQAVFSSVEAKDLIVFKVATITCIIQVLSQVPQAFLRVREQAKTYMLISSLILVLNILLTVYFVIILKMSIFGIVMAQCIGSGVALIMYYIPLVPMFVPEISFSMLRGPIKFSLPIIPHALAGIVFMYSDRIVLEKNVSLAVLGLYSFSDRIAQGFKILVNSVNSAYQPSFMKVAKMNPDAAVKDTQSFSKLFISILILIMTTFVLFSNELFFYIFDEKYRGAYAVAAIMSVGYLFRSLYCFTSSGLFYCKRTDKIAIISILAALLSVLLNLLLVPILSIYGAALAMVISFAATYGLAALFSKAIFPINIMSKAVALQMLVLLVSLITVVFVPESAYKLGWFAICRVVTIMISIVLGLNICGLFRTKELFLRKLEIKNA